MLVGWFKTILYTRVLVSLGPGNLVKVPSGYLNIFSFWLTFYSFLYSAVHFVL